MSNFSCVKCGGSWIDMGAMGYNTLCKHTMEEAMTATATPKTDHVMQHGLAMTGKDELAYLCRTFERVLAAMTAERDDYGNRLDRLADSHALTLKCYEEAEAENADLTKRLGQAHAALAHEMCEHGALLEEIRDRAQFGVSTHMSSDIVKMCDAALKGKGT